MTEHLNPQQLERATQPVQEWIKELGEKAVFDDPAQAYAYLRAVPHALRDRMTVEEAAHFGSQLPEEIVAELFAGAA